MKNTIKMSLVAAMAVAGLSQTASAGSLEEAIKGVSISGKVEVEYDYSDNNTLSAQMSPVSGSGDNTGNSWDLDIDATVKVPVNDNITAIVTVQADDAENTDNTATTNDNVDVAKHYFQYTNGPVTATAGKQGMAGAPWFDDERANGVVAMYNAGVATVAAANFTNVNAAPAVNGTSTTASLGNSTITAAAVIGKVGPVNASLWYANVAGITQNTGVAGTGIDADSYSINVNGSFDIVNVDVTYTDTDYDYKNVVAGTANVKDADLLKVIASVALEQATIYAGYGESGKDNADSLAGVDLTGDNDASVNMKMEILSIDDLNDAEAFLIGATIPVGALTLDVSYLDGDFKQDAGSIAQYDTPYNAGTAAAVGAGADFNEVLVQADYKMSKNFNIGAHYSTAEIGAADLDAASVSLEYKF